MDHFGVGGGDDQMSYVHANPPAWGVGNSEGSLGGDAYRSLERGVGARSVWLAFLALSKVLSISSAQPLL